MIGFETTGVFYNTEAMTAGEAAEFAGRIESLGYAALWLPESTGRDPFTHIAHLANHTERLGFATGIANIFHRLPGVTKQAALTLAEQTGDRFLLGLGVSHASMVEGLRGLAYAKPLAGMRQYLEEMEASPTTVKPSQERPQIVLAALGPKMLALAAEKTQGAHPYATTPEHTAQAREILGPGKELMVEQRVCLTADPEAARATINKSINLHTQLPNYVNNWLWLGFSQDEITSRAHRFVDSIGAWGTEETIRARVQAHYDAGATHVCIQPLNPDGGAGVPHWPALEALAPSLD